LSIHHRNQQKNGKKDTVVSKTLPTINIIHDFSVLMSSLGNENLIFMSWLLH